MLIYQIILFLPEKCAKVDRGLKPHNFEGREKGEIRSKSPLEGKTELAYFFSRVKHTSSPFSISIYSSDILFSATKSRRCWVICDPEVFTTSRNFKISRNAKHHSNNKLILVVIKCRKYQHIAIPSKQAPESGSNLENFLALRRHKFPIV